MANRPNRSGATFEVSRSLKIIRSVLSLLLLLAATGAFSATQQSIPKPTYRLQVVAVGQGTLTPNYSNAVLEIGKSYSMRAKGVNGYGFSSWVVSTNWVGGETSSNAALSFLMQSNLTVQANFVDNARPTITITAPAANSRTADAVVDITGTARDNDQVANVWVNVNGAGFVPANTQNYWTNWTLMQQPLIAGTNLLQGYAVDATGNHSTTSTLRFFFVVPSTLTVVTNGMGSITRSFAGDTLEVGRAYQVTAIPGAHQVFSAWVGTVQGSVVLASTSAKLTFLMQSNLVLQANFVPNPFPPVKGTYNGLFAEANPAQDSSGFFTLTLLDSGAFSGSLRSGANTYPFTGQLDAAGQATQVVSRHGTNPWVLMMSLDFVAQQVAGTVSNGVNGGWVAELGSDRQVFDARTNPAPYVGTYTMTIPGSTDDPPNLPEGNGYATLTVTSNGIATLNGSLADGTGFSQIVPVPQNGMLPLYAPLYKGGQGSVSSWLLFSDQPNSDFTGVLTWIKPQSSTGPFYTNGFTRQTEVWGLRYTPPARGVRVLNFTNAEVVLSGGNLLQSITNQVVLGSNNIVINLSPNRLIVTLTSSSGLVTGSVAGSGDWQINPLEGRSATELESGQRLLPGDERERIILLGSTSRSVVILARTEWNKMTQSVGRVRGAHLDTTTGARLSSAAARG